MDINNFFEKAFKYAQQGLNFSALNFLKEVYQKEKSPFAKMKYAHQLSECGYFSLSTKVFAEIDMEQLPKSLWYMKYQYEGHHFLKIGEMAKAKKAYLKSLSYRDDSTVPYVFASIACAYEKTQEEAIKILQSGLGKEGDKDEVCYLLAKLYLINGDVNLALKYLNQSLEITPDYEIAQLLKDDLFFCKTFDNIEFKENTSIENLIELAKKCEEDGKDFSAMSLWQIILLRKPSDFVKFRLGDQLRLCGNLNEAEKMFLQVKVNKIPINHRFLYYIYLSQLYYDRFDWYKALRTIEKTLKYKSNSVEAYILYASILSKQEKNEEAITFLQKGLTIYGINSESYYFMAVNSMIIGDIDSTLKYINCSLEAEPNHDLVHILKKDVLTARSQ
jgi:tetratricopeptide (TPR) repeat protein